MDFELEELQRDNESLQRENGALIRELRESQKYILSLEKALNSDAEKETLKQELKKLQLKFLSMGNELITEIDNSYELKKQLGLYTYGLDFDL